MTNGEIDALKYIALLLAQSLDPKTQRDAEGSLKAFLTRPDSLTLLLNLVSGENLSVDKNVSIAAALLLKNHVRKEWQNDGAMNQIPDTQRTYLKENIVRIMASAEKLSQGQLGETIGLIAASDFPDLWPNLLQNLISHLSLANFATNIAVLATLNRIFKRYRREFRSDELFMEINFVLSQFAEPLLQLYHGIDNIIGQNSQNREELLLLITCQAKLNKIFYSLSSQDLPAYFEDHLSEFMAFFQKQFVYRNAIVEADEFSEPGPAEKLVASVAKIIILYAQRYEEEFAALPEFVKLSWQVSINLSRNLKHDVIACLTMKFLSVVSRQQRYKGLFEGGLKILCDSIIVPNMFLRDSDLEAFEDDPMEYIRHGLEGSTDEKSRLESCFALVKGLMEFFESDISLLLLNYVESYINTFKLSPTTAWKEKDAAINIFTAVAAKAIVASHGVTRVSSSVNVDEFFKKHIYPDLQLANEAMNPMLKVDAIKFLYNFRLQLSKENLKESFPLLVHYLSSNHPVIYTYSALLLDKLLGLKKDTSSLLDPNEMRTICEPAIENLLKLINLKRSPEKIAENEYLMKALMHVIIVANVEYLSSSISRIFDNLLELLKMVTANPSNPKFNHYLFEAIIALLRTCRSNPRIMESVETRLITSCQAILQSDGNSEFLSYIFQVYVGILEFRPLPGIPEALYPTIGVVFQPVIWSNVDSIPALVRFLQACIFKDPAYVIQNNLLAGFFGIFQVLISSRTNDIYGFQLFQSLLQFIPMNCLDAFLKPTFIQLCSKLQNSKATRTSIGFLHCISTFLLSSGLSSTRSSSLVRIFEEIQPRLFINICRNVFLPTFGKITDSGDKKFVSVALIELVANCPELLSGDADFNLCWISIIKTLMGQQLEEAALEIVDSTVEDVMTGEVETIESFNKLALLPSQKKYLTLVSSVDNPFVHMITKLAQVLAKDPTGKINSLLKTGLDASQLSLFNSALERFRITLQ